MPQQFDTDAEDGKLARLRVEEEEDLARILSEKYGLTYTDLSLVPVNVDALRVIPEKVAREAEAVAFDKSTKHLSVAVRNPHNPAFVNLVRELEGQDYTLETFMVSAKSLTHALERYSELSYSSESKAGVFDITGLEDLANEMKTVADLRSHIERTLLEKKGSQVSEILEEILAAAFGLKASDIHIEPEEESVRLRLRLDGVLTETYSFTQDEYRHIASRIKLLSGLKLNIHDRAQDGRFTVVRGAEEIDIRTSDIPGGYGESFVLRILDPHAIAISFEELGIDAKLQARLEREMRRANGMLLTTGPTGSGKTTSLYAFMRHIHTPEIKIVTIEDPIEYHLPGIVQTQTNGSDYTFASGLRSVLRQDPDVIMVGEIRDAEVADVAIQAALTGHFVFSTLHTNNAAGTFPRLVDLGADPKSFASAITVAMAQRLVRKLDPNMRKQVPLTEEEKTMVEKILSTVEDKSLLPASIDMTWVPDVDPASVHETGITGYKGRMGLYEAIFMDDQLGEFLRDNPSEGDIAKEVRRQGFLTMAQQGVLRALDGTTSLDEVFKVVDLPRD